MVSGTEAFGKGKAGQEHGDVIPPTKEEKEVNDPNGTVRTLAYVIIRAASRWITSPKLFDMENLPTLSVSLRCLRFSCARNQMTSLIKWSTDWRPFNEVWTYSYFNKSATLQGNTFFGLVPQL